MADRVALAVRIRVLPHAEGLELPVRASPDSAGCDLRAAVTGDLVLEPGQRSLVPTGLVIELPSGCEGQVRPRSGLALRHGVTVLNAPGTIDADYRGEIQVLLVNLGAEPFVIRRGERIAQLVVARHESVAWSRSEALADSGRGAGGFGSTGSS